MTTIVRNGQKIRTEWHSTPARFVALLDDYCGCPECSGKYPIGTGKSVDAAIADLIEQIEEAA
jgi:hypothetical protein